jgi:hypothetical protein
MGAALGPALDVFGMGPASIQADAAENAARTSANAQTRAAQLAADASAFRPVGITNRFGTSNFTMDGNRLTGANYTLSPELQQYQDYLSKQTQAGLGDTSRLLSLGREYIGEDPQAVRQRYIDQQKALLAPENEQALAGIRNNLFQSGRSGLATGATTAGDMAATNPEMAAYYNALAKQNAALTAGAEQAAQQQVTYGQGLLSSAYSPFQTSLGLMGSVENLGMQPLSIGSELGGRALQGGQSAAQALLTGGTNAARTLQGAMGTSPTAAGIFGLTQSPGVNKALSDWWSTPSYGGTPQGAYGQQSSYMQQVPNSNTQQAQMLNEQNSWFN